MQRRSSELQLAVQEYLDVDWTHVKYYLRRQIAKCVNECKSQASDAKKLVGTIRHRPPNKQRVDSNAEYEYNSDDYDDWDSDFDEDFDDESIEETSVAAPITNSVIENKTIKNEENYEIVETPPVIEKPVLFPRSNGTVLNSPPPPPLPHKPPKFQSSLLNHDTLPIINRPKLPTVDDNSNDGAGSLATFMNSILGRRSSTPSSSPKTSHHSFRDLSGNFSSADSQSSRSSSPDKDGLFMVGGSAFFSSPSSSWSSDSKVPPQIPMKSKYTTTDDIAQTMASRPLPPVPTIDVKMQVNNQRDLQSYPWFHEVERDDAENEIKNLGVSGAFLVRPSKRAGKENPYTVTVLYENKIFHLNIRQRLDATYALGKEKKKEKTFPSVPDLIAYHQKEKILLTARGESAGQTTLNAFPEK